MKFNCQVYFFDICLWNLIIKNIEIISSENVTKRNYWHHSFKWSYRWAVVNPLQDILWSCMDRNSSTVLQRILRCKIAIKQYLIAMRNKEQCSIFRQKNICLFPYPILLKYLLYLQFIIGLKYHFIDHKNLTWSNRYGKYVNINFLYASILIESIIVLQFLKPI